jgi:hypothetical protein
MEGKRVRQQVDADPERPAGEKRDERHGRIITSSRIPARNSSLSSPRRRRSTASPPEHNWSSSSPRRPGSRGDWPVRLAAPPQGLLAWAPAFAGATVSAWSSSIRKPGSPACSPARNSSLSSPRRRRSTASPPEHNWSSSSPRRPGSRGDRPVRLAAPPQGLLAWAPAFAGATVSAWSSSSRRRGSPVSPPERTWSPSSPRRRGSRGDRPARLAAPHESDARIAAWRSIFPA